MILLQCVLCGGVGVAAHAALAERFVPRAALEVFTLCFIARLVTFVVF